MLDNLSQMPRPADSLTFVCCFAEQNRRSNFLILSITGDTMFIIIFIRDLHLTILCLPVKLLRAFCVLAKSMYNELFMTCKSGSLTKLHYNYQNLPSLPWHECSISVSALWFLSNQLSIFDLSFIVYPAVSA